MSLTTHLKYNIPLHRDQYGFVDGIDGGIIVRLCQKGRFQAWDKTVLYSGSGYRDHHAAQGKCGTVVKGCQRPGGRHECIWNTEKEKPNT